MIEAARVVGAGVVGLCVAAELERRGVAVTVIDREAGPGPHACSWWAGGMLAPFCEAAVTEEPVARLGRDAAEWWERAGADVVRRGSLVVALGRDRRELDRFARRTSGYRILSADALAEIEPQLAGRFDRALFFPDEAHLDPRAALAGLQARLANRGVAFVTGAAPADADAITLDCRGLSARDALPDLRGVKGEMAVLRAPDIRLGRPVRLLHPRHPLYVVPRGDGSFMVGATQIESGDRHGVSVRSALELLSVAYALDPAFGEAELVEVGADARPAFPDNLPRLRRVGKSIHVNGLFRHGFLLSPAMAQMAADLVCDGIIPEVFHEDRR